MRPKQTLLALIALAAPLAGAEERAAYPGYLPLVGPQQLRYEASEPRFDRARLLSDGWRPGGGKGARPDAARSEPPKEDELKSPGSAAADRSLVEAARAQPEPEANGRQLVEEALDYFGEADADGAWSDVFGKQALRSDGSYFEAPYQASPLPLETRSESSAVYNRKEAP